MMSKKRKRGTQNLNNLLNFLNVMSSVFIYFKATTSSKTNTLINMQAPKIYKILNK